MDLQGQPGDGKSCGLVNVQQDIECITEELTSAYERFKSAPPLSIEGEWHFATQIKFALDKAQQYYAKIDELAAYIAAVVLHPRYNWQYVEAQWEHKKTWITSARKSVKHLWLTDYKQQPISEALSPEKKKPKRELNIMEAYRIKGLQKSGYQRRSAVMQDEYDRYYTQNQVEDCETPIEWWRTIGREQYPHLAQMAIDLLSIPAMSDEPERIFSRLGQMITKRRNHLEQSTIQATSCLYSWDKNKIIDLRLNMTPLKPTKLTPLESIRSKRRRSLI